MRWILIAVGVVGVLAVAVYFAVRHETATTDSVAERPSPLPAIDVDRVTKLVLEHRVGEGDEAADQTVVLVKGEAEGDAEPQWRLVEPVEAEADSTAVDSLIKRLKELEVDDVASEMRESHEELEVNAEKGIHVQVFAGETRLAEFILGKYLSGHTMLRLPDSDVVWRARSSLRYVFGRRAADWRDKKIFDFERTQIGRVEFQGPGGTFAFTRDLSSEESEWTVESVDATVQPEEGTEGEPRRVTRIEDFDQSKVRSLVTSLARLRCTDFQDEPAGAETGLEGEKAARVTFTVGSGEAAKSYTLVIGGEKDDRATYARRADGDQTYLLTKYLAERFRVDVGAFQKRQPPSKRGEGPEATKASPGSVPPEVLDAAKREMDRQKLLQQLATQAAQGE